MNDWRGRGEGGRVKGRGEGGGGSLIPVSLLLSVLLFPLYRTLVSELSAVPVTGEAGSESAMKTTTI